MSGDSEDHERPGESPVPSPALVDRQATVPQRLQASEASPVASGARPPGPSRRRIWTARIVALVADGIQIALLPLVLGGAASPIEDAIDIATAVVLSGLLGFRWAFLPTFIAEMVPFVDLAPSWTLAVFITTRGKGGHHPTRA